MVILYMKHRETTADKNYVLKVNAKRSATAHEMRDLIRETTTENQKEISQPKPALSLKAKPALSLKAKPALSLKAKPALSLNAKPALSLKAKPALTLIPKPSFKSNRTNLRRTLNLLRTPHQPSATTTGKFVINQRKVKKIYDFVRYKTSVAIQTTDIKETDPYDFDGVKSLPSSSLIRKQWHEDDVKCINQRFKHLESMPSKSRTIQMFNEDEVLKHLLQREGKERCYEKVKTCSRN
ncbi:hypothetical protein OS493_012336 [Desmophyllum pertusum]|uniref:Uncharacterized protein n=1 Tax=Desmophyllum pertusum TaxID=174260 RepID=A0A9W9ZS74_9CNID|nr:hypothetical protein OS493_012336 [Desmophyllum pertusum]